MSTPPQQPANQAAALIIMIALGVGGAWMYGNFMKATNEASQVPAKAVDQGYVPTPRNPSQAITINDTALYGAYDDNEARFKQQYVGKTVNVTGTVYSISDNSIWFQSSTICYFTADQTEKVMQLSKGQTLTVQAVVEEAFVGFRLADCVIVQ